MKIILDIKDREIIDLIQQQVDHYRQADLLIDDLVRIAANINVLSEALLRCLAGGKDNGSVG